VQDLPAAALYSKAGYEEVASDSFLVRLLALDQRRLMRKRIEKAEEASAQKEQEQQQQPFT
jgi:tagatose-1,6-bisphosphate aldolase